MRRFFKLKPLFVLPFLAFISFHFSDIKQSDFFNIYLFFFSIFIVLFLDLCFFYIYRVPYKFIDYILSIFYVSFLVVLFGLNIVDFFQKMGHELLVYPYSRGRIWLPLIFLILIYLQITLTKFKNGSYLQNVFWSILCVQFTLQIIFGIYDSEPSYIKIKKTESVDFISKKYSKLLLLLILDEYSSPDELTRLSLNKSPIIVFSNKLKSNGWILKESFKSEENSTIHSIGSLLNLNLSNTKSFSSTNIFNLADKCYLSSPPLIDSLKSKSVKVSNFGIFNLGSDSKPFTRLYFYPTNFVELIFYYSILPRLWYNTDGFRISGLKLSYYPMEVHNKILLESLPNFINLNSSKKTFVYAHLYMPHSPISFRPGIFREKVDFKNYVDYWQFTNTKVLDLFSKINLNNGVRVIITGDHGFRGDKKINPYNTFAAFWGFEKDDVDKVKTVQDLGILINAYY